MAPTNNNPVILKRNSEVGAPDAESDDVFLENCFQDTGDLETILDCSNPKCLVLGRTGTGKTALLRQVLRSCEHAVELSPEALSLNYVLNSNVLRFFEEAGVKLDIFYALLWRHILTVELLKLRYDITNQTKQNEFLERMRGILTRNVARQRALKYLSDWGDQFWTETDYRTKEFTRKLETQLSAAVKIDAHYLNLGADGARKLTEEEKIEVRDKGMQVVDDVQIKDLHEQKHHYIVIDRLDEGWVDDSLRFKLIKSLIETLRTFQKVRPIKIIVALRTDLHYRVLKETDQAGFQEEKYRSLYLPLKWTRTQLVELLDKRIGYMFRRKYTTEGVHLKDIMPPNQIDRRSSEDYILDRTFFRPREAIIYLNECIARSVGSSKITVGVLRQVEVGYSQQRLSSLGTEWKREYPNLERCTKVLDHRKTPFKIDEISDDEAKALALRILEHPAQEVDPIYAWCQEYYLGGKASKTEFLQELIAIFYHVGLVGIKPEPHLGRQWSFEDEPVLERAQIKPQAQIDIHKTFWAALGVSRLHKAQIEEPL
jgi:Cdc6-like AAA superfamily ATPase